jgi:ABC-type multidrug transport system fused ATPase/permease subunit
MGLVAANACSVYLMSFYGRLVVDNILVITPAAEQGAGIKRRIWAPDRDRPVTGRPRQGLGRRMDLGLSATDRPPGAGRRLFLLAVMYMATQIVLNVLSRVSNRRHITVGQGITGALREDMHKKVLTLGLSYHQSTNPGRLLSRILSDVAVVQNQMMSTITMLAQALSMIVVGSVILIVASWQMALIAGAVIPLYAIVYRRSRPRIRELSKEMRHTNSCMFGFVSQKVDGIKAIQAYAREGRERLNFHRLAAVFLRDALGQQRISAGLSRASTIISGLCSAGVFLLGAHWVLQGRMSLGKMMFVRATTMNLFPPVLQLAQLSVTLSSLQVSLQRVVDILDRPLDIADSPDAVDFPRPLKSGIELRHVAFSYPSSDQDETDDPVLRDVSLKVPAGSWLCVMGASGCGKTTLLQLLSRLYEPTRGRILVDGVPLDKVRLASLRRRVGVVPQEAQIFSGTVRENICYGVPDAEPAAIMAAAKAAQLHDFILEMKVQYETVIGEKGTSLSGGQRQRLSLARALLTDPDVLILDDCTSALDADTERRIQDTLAEILVDKTAIIVSQRVSMAKRCHRICTLENGIVSEFGTHDELVSGNGFYAKLHAQQTE